MELFPDGVSSVIFVLQLLDYMYGEIPDHHRFFPLQCVSSQLKPVY